MRTAIVLPTFNEAPRVGSVVRGLAPYGTPIVVDDHSTDGSGETARAAGALVVRHKENSGYDAAIQSGFELAQSLGMEVVVTCDADGQHEPLFVGASLAPIREGRAKMVLGIRPSPARLSEHLFDFYTRLRFGVPDILCGLKAYTMELYEDCGRFDGYGSIGTELALHALRRKVPYEMIEVPIRPRRGSSRFGKSLKADYRILRAMALGIREDFRGKRLR